MAEDEGRERPEAREERMRRDRKQLDEAFAPENYAGLPGSPPVTDKGASSLPMRPKKLSHRLKYLAQLKAMGLTNVEIAERSGYTTQRLTVIFNSPNVSNEVERSRRAMFARDPEVALRTMLPKALENIKEVLEYETESFKEKRAKSDVAFQLLERTHGKPSQHIDVGGNLIADLYTLLDQRTVNAVDIEAESRALGRDAEEAEIVHEGAEQLEPLPGEPAPDPFESFLDAQIGESTVDAPSAPSAPERKPPLHE